MTRGMRSTKLVTIAFGALLLLLFVLSSVAWAQGVGIAPELAVASPVGPMTVDLGNLTLPGALVLVAWMYRDGIPFQFHHTHHNVRNPEGDDGSGAWHP